MNTKNYKVKGLLLLIGIVLSSVSMAQIGPKPEDISPLLIGESVPDLNLKTINGGSQNLKKLVSSKPTILIFYRGGWCPYCSKHLSGIGEIESQIAALGYQVVAISPDQPSKLAESKSNLKLNYSLYSDSALVVSKAMGIVFQAPDHYLKTIDQASAGINKTGLPVPSVFVLNTNGLIEFEYINPNIKNRLKSKLLLSVLEGLRP